MACSKNDQRLAFAFGFGFGRTRGGPYLDFPTYFSFHPPQQDLAVYLSPRYTFLFLNDEESQDDYDATQMTFLGANFGLIYTGRAVDVGLDIGLFDLRLYSWEDYRFGNISLGVKSRF